MIFISFFFPLPKKIQKIHPSLRAPFLKKIIKILQNKNGLIKVLSDNQDFIKNTLIDFNGNLFDLLSYIYKRTL